VHFNNHLGLLPTEENPADLLTRGITATSLKSLTLWSNGPLLLCKKAEWPTWTASPTTPLLAAAAITEDFVPANSAPHQAGPHNIINPGNYSKLGKLLAITAYVMRFIHNLKSATTKQDGPLTSDELYNAKML